MIKSKFHKNISLTRFTTIKVGGETEYLAEPTSESELVNSIKWAKLNHLEFRVIGAGSNLLIRNIFLEGLTICTKKLKSIVIDQSKGLVYAECGVMLPTLASLLAKKSCKGGEWIVGIPGTIGGAIFMNAGYGEFSISQNLLSVKILNTKNLCVYEIDKEDLEFSYRFSSFQQNNFIVLSAKFNFEPNGNTNLITDKTKSNLKIKTSTQPYHLPSFGSVFKNPKNNFAGKLIEETGLKGFKLGGAQVSLVHANFIVNNSCATSDDIYNLITLIQQKVLQKKGIFLHPEVRMIGY